MLAGTPHEASWGFLLSKQPGLGFRVALEKLETSYRCGCVYIYGNWYCFRKIVTQIKFLPSNPIIERLLKLRESRGLTVRHGLNSRFLGSSYSCSNYKYVHFPSPPDPPKRLQRCHLHELGICGLAAGSYLNLCEEVGRDFRLGWGLGFRA